MYSMLHSLQGMSYLHDTNIKYHGWLKSSNVLIDSRWTVKVADYGLRLLRDGEKQNSVPGDHAYYYSKSICIIDQSSISENFGPHLQFRDRKFGLCSDGLQHWFESLVSNVYS